MKLSLRSVPYIKVKVQNVSQLKIKLKQKRCLQAFSVG